MISFYDHEIDVDNVLYQKKGVFYISTQTIVDVPEIVKKIMGQCIILRCEHIMIEEKLFYHAISDSFDQVEIGEIIPTYEWTYDPIKEEILACKK